MNNKTRTFMRSKLINAMAATIEKNPPAGANSEEIENLIRERGLEILAMSDLDLEATYQVMNIVSVAIRQSQLEKELRDEEKKQKGEGR